MSRNIVAKNIGWRLLERFGAQGVTFIVSVILARLLEPSTYGVVALVTVIISIISVFIDSGLACSLAQKKDADDLDFSSVFYFNIFMCILLYVFLFAFAPLIENFYNIEGLSSIVRVLGITLLISGFKNVQGAYVSRNLLFKKYFFSTLGGTIISAIIGIWMAYHGFGVWALVFQNVISNLVDTIILWCTVEWKPKKIFSFSRLKSLFNFGWKILASSLLDTIWRQLRQLIIGKEYSTEDLAYYNKGSHYPDTTISSIITSFDSVLLPVMSNNKDDVSKVKSLARKSIRVCSFVVLPMMLGLAACADNLIKLILTDKWMPVVPYLRVFCITYAFYPIHTTNLNSIKAVGRSDVILKLEVIKKIIGCIAIIVSMQFGVFAMALSTVFTSVISQVINAWPNKYLINYKYTDQLKDIMPSLLLSVAMGLFVYLFTFLNLNSFMTLFIQVITGIVFYIGVSYLLRIDSLFYWLDIFSSIDQRIRHDK